MRRTLITVAAVAVLTAPAGSVTPATAAPYCGITWGSTDKIGDGYDWDGIYSGVRAGQHECYDRLVIDFDGAPGWYWVGYVDAVSAEGTSDVVPLRGGARLAISLGAPAQGYDVQTGETAYVPDSPTRLVDVSGWRTFRQVAWAGSFGGFTSLGLGVRARLPFRVMVLEGPGDGSRVVIDVAHQW